MASSEALRTAFERNARALAARPSLGRKTVVTKISVRDGTTCDIEHGTWKFTADVGTAQGGNDAGPGPGVLERAALGSCLAIGYATWAARMDIPIEELRVDVESDIDSSGMFGLSEQPPGFVALRYHVTIQSPASEEAILEMIDMADRHSPVLDDFRRPLPVSREVTVVTPTAANS